MFPATERSVGFFFVCFFFFPPTEDACVCDGVRVCVYFISAPAAGEITSTLYSVTAIRRGKRKKKKAM